MFIRSDDAYLWMKDKLGITSLNCPEPPRCGPVRVSACPHSVGMSSLTRAEIGALGEQLAVEHLRAAGLRILTRNWRCRYGELDVIAADPDRRTVVFVEVKTRTGTGFGGWAEAVTVQKVRRIRRLAALWLAEQGARWAAVRIDVIGIQLTPGREPALHHLQGVG